MAKPAIEPEIDAALVPLADRLSALPGVKVFDGARDDEGWWQLLFRIDVGCDNAWRTVRILASLFNTIIPTDEKDGRPIFFPVALPAPDFDPNKGPYWSLSHLYADYNPDDATTVLSEYLVWENMAQATDGDFDVRRSPVRINPRLAPLSKKLSALPGVKVCRGSIDEDGWWRLLFVIDVKNNHAWRTVRMLASIFNSGTQCGEDMVIFEPAYPPSSGSIAEDGPYWWLKMLWGKFTPDEACHLMDIHFDLVGDSSGERED